MQWNAIDLLAEIAAELCLEMQFESGDLQILKSHVTYHSRSAYEDNGGPTQQRVLYRLWVCPPVTARFPKTRPCSGAIPRAGRCAAALARKGEPGFVSMPPVSETF